MYDENLRLRLENHRLKNKINKFKFLLKKMNFIHKKPLNKHSYKFFYIKFIFLLKKWEKIYIEMFCNDFYLLFNLNQKYFLLDIILMKKKTFEIIIMITKHVDIIKFLGSIVSKLFLICIICEKRFTHIKKIFDQMLTQKLFLLYNNKYFKKMPKFKSNLLNIQPNNLKSYNLEKMSATSMFIKSKNFMNFTIKENINKETKRNQNISYEIFIHVKKVEYKLLFWINSFLFKISNQKVDLTEVFDKLNIFYFLMTNFLEIFSSQVVKTDIKNSKIFLVITKFLKKFENLKKNLRNFSKFKINVDKKKLKKQINKNIFKTILQHRKPINYNENFVFTKIKNISVLLKRASSIKEFIYYLYLDKTNRKQFDLNKKSFFNNISKFVNLKKYKNTSKEILKQNFNIKFKSIWMKLGIHRVSDVDKEMNLIWIILKIFNFLNYKNFFLSNELIKVKYVNMQYQYYKLKNEFNRIIFILKQKTFLFQKNNEITKNLINKNIEKKKEIENKLHEIKSMEIDFSEILNQIKKN